jgi:hypothetical protein
MIAYENPDIKWGVVAYICNQSQLLREPEVGRSQIQAQHEQYSEMSSINKFLSTKSEN